MGFKARGSHFQERGYDAIPLLLSANVRETSSLCSEIKLRTQTPHYGELY
jgi:hypothetical protein